MAPVLSFLAEETYSYMKGNKQESVFLLDFPQAKKEWSFPELAEDYQLLLGLRETAAKELELLRAAKTIGSSLEAQLTLTVDDKAWPVVKKFEDELREFFIVSKVNIEKGPVKVSAKKAEGEKCIRCWNYDIKTGANEKFVGVCPKCVEALL
jgi:isoleucyl-tRNA synthetase